MPTDKRGEGCGIFVPLSPEEKDHIERIVNDRAPGMKLGKFGRTALFHYLHITEKRGEHELIAEILGA